MVLKNVTVSRKAELSYGGRVSKRTVVMAGGEMKSLGLVQPGTYRLTTEAAETIEISQGHCRVKLPGDQAWVDYEAGQSFEVPADSQFEIEVEDVLDYISHVDTGSGP